MTIHTKMKTLACIACADRRPRVDSAAGEEGLAWGERAGLQQRHPGSQQHPPYHHHQVQAPGPRHRRPRRPPRYIYYVAYAPRITT